MEKALDFTDSSFVDALHLIVFDDGYPDGPGITNAIGKLFWSRYKANGHSIDVDRAILQYRASARLTKSFNGGNVSQFFDLGLATLARFESLRDPADIDEARLCFEGCLAILPRSYTMSYNLGVALNYRFRRLGDIADIQRATIVLQAALSNLPYYDLERPGCLNLLGTSLQERFNRLGDVSDIETSIDALHEAERLTPDTDTRKLGYLSNLGVALLSRFGHAGNRSDLEAAMSSWQKAVELTPDGHPDKPALFNNLAAALQSRFNRLGNVSDLEAAIDSNRKAVELTPDGHPDKPALFNNLGNALQSRFERLWHRSDIDDAIRCARKALEMTPDMHARRPINLVALAKFIISKHMRFGEVEEELHTVLNALATSAQSTIGDPRHRLAASRLWASWSDRIKDEQQALQAYGCAVSLIPQAAWMGMAIEGRHTELEDLGNLVSEAVEMAVRSGRPDLALEWLEQGRSVVWNQTLQLRSPLDILRDRDPTRAQRLTEISLALESNSKDNSLSMEDSGRQLRALSLEWEALLSEVRRLDGFEEFLGPKKVAQLLAAASFAPIVVLTPHNTGCTALILIEGSDEVIHLPLQLTSQTIEELIDSLQRAQFGRSLVREADDDRHLDSVKRREVDPEERIKPLLAELRATIVKPVLDALAFSLPDNLVSDLPRICWCPTGSLSFLPIHAAGMYDTEEPGTKVFEFVVSSYTPTVTALLQPPSENLAPPKILAVSQAQYVGRSVSALPSAKHEMKSIRNRAVASSVEFEEISDGAGTVERVLQGMKTSTWIHLACHGVQNLSNPTKSSFILADDDLELEEIIKHPLPHAQLAFLSACQTAAGDAKLADEAVHLAAGMMLAGYRSVIATMWSMYDQDGPVVADVVYAELLKDGKANYTRAAYALHKATNRLREAKRPFLAWMPFIHMGM